MRAFTDAELEELAALAKAAFGDVVDETAEDMSETLSLMYASGASEAEIERALAEHDATIDARIRRRIVEMLSPKRSLH